MGVELRIWRNRVYNGSRNKDKGKYGLKNGVELRIWGNMVYNGSRTKDMKKYGLQWE